MKSYLSGLFIAFAVLIYFIFQNGNNKHPFAGLNASELIIKNDYPLEIHECITDDGYILTLHRIPHMKELKNYTRKAPVLLVPGVIHSASEYLNMGSNHSLAFILSNAGYDVWLLNPRGTTWSRKHVTLDPDKDKQFWHFSFHEVGNHDVIETINYILEKTSYLKLHLIGFSQGTTSIFIALSEKSEYNNKILTFTAMSPAIYMTKVSGLIQRFFKLIGATTGLVKIHPKLKKFGLLLTFVNLLLINKLLHTRRSHPNTEKIIEDLLGFHEMFAQQSFISTAYKFTCHQKSLFLPFCYMLFSLSTGNSKKISVNKLEVITSNVPAGSSARQFAHYISISEYNDFIKFDHGKEKNLLIYGQDTPPVYALSSVTAPIFVYYGTKDLSLSYEDIERAIKVLPNCVEHIKLENYTHLDFLYADDSVNLIYKPLIKNMDKYN